MPRISLITDKSQVPADRHAEFDRIVEILHRVGGPFGVLMHSPGLAQKVCETGAWVRLNSTLKPAERELIIIAVAVVAAVATVAEAFGRSGGNVDTIETLWLKRLLSGISSGSSGVTTVDGAPWRRFTSV